MYDLEKAAAFVVKQLDVSDLEQITYEHILQGLKEQSPAKREETFSMYKEIYNYDGRAK